MKRKLITLFLTLACFLGGTSLIACDKEEKRSSSQSSSIGSSASVASSSSSVSVESSSSESAEDSSLDEPEEPATPTEGLKYTLSSDGTYYSVTGIGTATDTDVVIPATYNDVPVTTIRRSAFDYCDSLTSITIPSSVTTIGSCAFYGCYRLTSITIPSSVTTIGSYAFYGCYRLTSVDFGDNSWLTTIGEGAFNSCDSLTSVYITDIAAWCNIDFENCAANPLWRGADLYLNNELVTELEIPSTVTEIKPYAFLYCYSLTSVTIPSSVTTIEEDAFYYCKSLTSVYITDIAAWYNIDFGSSAANPLSNGANLYLNNELVTKLEIPSTVTEIKPYAFYNCDLTSVTIPDSVTTIGDRAFFYCDKLVEVINKSSLNITAGDGGNGYVGYYAKQVIRDKADSKLKMQGDYLVYEDGENSALIAYCGTATEITLPDSIDGNAYEINQYAFYNNYKITSVTIPSGVTTIGSDAFKNCTSLTSVTFGNNSQLTTIGSRAFEYCDSLTSVDFGDNSQLTTIGAWAFSDCYDLTSIIIPSKVTTIGENAFAYCDSLTSVTFENTEGWFVTEDETATSGTPVNVTDPATNATYLTTTYDDYDWKRTVA